MICRSYGFSMAVSKEGLSTWGKNDSGQLGHGDKIGLSEPKVVEALRGQEVLMLSAGWHHSMAVTREGLHTWGNAAYGQLGHGDSTGLSRPKVVSALQDRQVLMVSAGSFHSMAVTKEGLFTWGKGESGCLGHGDTQNQVQPKFVTSLQGKQILQISAGYYHSMAVTPEGVFTWGKGDQGLLGHGDEADQTVPKLIQGLRGKKFISISAGTYHSLALTTEGLYTWGDGSSGCLGHGDSARQYVPKKVEALKGIDILMVCGGLFCSMAVSREGVYSWGKGDSGRLGHGDKEHQYTPKRIVVLQGKQVLAICAGDEHSMTLTTDGLYSWGGGKDGRLGHGDAADQLSPKLITTFGVGSPAANPPIVPKTAEASLITQTAKGLQDLQGQLSAAMAEKCKAEEEVIRLREENKRVQNSLAGKEVQLVALAGEKGKLEEEVVRLREQSKRIQKSLTGTHPNSPAGEKGKLEQEIVRLREQNKQVQKSLAAKDAQLTFLAGEKGKLDDEVLRLAMQNKLVQSSLAEKVAQLTSLAGEKGKFEEEATHLRQVNRSLHNNLEALQREKAMAEAEVMNLTRKLEEAQECLWAALEGAKPASSVVSGVSKRSFASSAFKRIYGQTQSPRYAHELLHSLSEVLKEYCGRVGLRARDPSQDSPWSSLFEELQSEAFQDAHTLRTDPAKVAQMLWTSARVLSVDPPEHCKELCFIINAMLRWDDPELLVPLCVLVRGINQLCVVPRAGTDPTTLPFPPDGQCYRGGG
eukprot:RCo052474